MRIVDPGYTYELDSLDGDFKQFIRFVKRFRGDFNHAGTINQDVLRVLIDRVEFLQEEKPWPLNEQIIYHLRMALVLHEARALIRKAEKGQIFPELLPVSSVDGHYIFEGEEVERDIPA